MVIGQVASEFNMAGHVSESRGLFERRTDWLSSFATARCSRTLPFRLPTVRAIERRSYRETIWGMLSLGRLKATKTRNERPRPVQMCCSQGAAR